MAELVVLVHGLARSARSMERLAAHLRGCGYDARTLSYPSRQLPIAGLVSQHIAPGIRGLLSSARAAAAGRGAPPPRLSFVTHSLGGILVGEWLNGGGGGEYADERAAVRRVVMLAPPLGGSEIVDALGGLWLFRAWNGPAGAELGTRGAPRFSALPRGAAAGVVAGRASQPGLGWLLPRPNDGKVSVASTRGLRGAPHAVVGHTHTFIMNKRDVQELVRRFLESGAFSAEEGQTGRGGDRAF